MIGAAILAGGRGERLGGATKALITVAGRRIVDRQLAVLQPIADEILLVGPAAELAGVAARLVPDLRPGLGPLAGLEAALAATRAEQLLVVAGDLPALSARALALLVAAAPEADAVVPRVAGRAEPLHARYARRALPAVRASLDAGERALHRMLDRLNVAWIDEPALRAVDPELLTLADVDAPEDLARIERALQHAL
jgi:molybdopterin-guanine dinucleotide biosynthesis protein A